MVEIAEPTNARSRRTRSAMLDAAREILEQDGFEALTMAAVAERADVSRGAAYLHFASRADLVACLFDHIASQQRLDESMEAVWSAPDAVNALERWAEHLARYHPPLIAIDRAIQRVEARDPAAGQHRRRVIDAQLTSCRRLARWLTTEDLLAPGLTESTATDLLYGLISTDLIDRLLTDRSWGTDRLAHHLALLLRRGFTRERPEAADGGA